MVAQSLQCNLGNRVDSLGTSARVPAAARQFSTEPTNFHNEGTGLNMLLVLILRIYVAITPQFSFPVQYLTIRTPIISEGKIIRII
jgi:hypothetical protein